MLVDIIKSNKILYTVARAIKWFIRIIIVENVLGFLFTLLPIRKNKIIASHFYGRPYGDNPKAIVGELLSRKKKLDIVWVLDGKFYNSELPEGVRRVKYGSVRFMYEMATAKVWIDNVRKFVYPRKRKGQYYIQTWHGSLGVKKVEGDAMLSATYVKHAKKDSANADLFLSGCKSTSAHYRSSFWFNGEIFEYGDPKLDFLINSYKNKEIIKEIRRKLFLKNNIKKMLRIALYAPTFRNASNEKINLDYDKLRRVLKKKFGGEWTICLRFHPNMADVTREKTGDVCDLTNYPDAYELLLASDIIITDYSSLGFEAAVIEKPVFIYAPDYDQYLEKERGFYYSYEELPFPFSRTNNELERTIMDYKEEDASRVKKELSKILGVEETGEASKKVVDRILEIIA